MFVKKMFDFISGDLTVITIGTLTNVALAVRLDPAFISRLNHLYIGAGHIHSKYSFTKSSDREPTKLYGFSYKFQIVRIQYQRLRY